MDSEYNKQKMALEIKTSVGLRVISIEEILFIEARKKFSIVNLSHELIVTFHSLKWYQEYLIGPCFYRCHNSFLVNCHFIDGYSRKEIRLKNNHKIPLSRARIKTLVENLKTIYDK